jgi:hypothetical protein
VSWDTTGASTTTSNVFTIRYSGTTATTDTVSTFFYSNDYGITGGYGFTGYNAGYATAGGFGVTSYGGGQSRRGFAPDQVRQIREDFDIVKTDRKRKRAEARARGLFRQTVGDILYRRFLERGYHEIRGKSGVRYRIAPGQWVKVMEENEQSSEKIKHLLCAHLPFGVPWFDTMVVQSLMLSSSKETEERFLSIANVHSVDGPYPIPELEVAA